MTPTKLAGIALVILGGLALAYGGFSYTKDTQAVKLGPLELTVKEKQTVNVPLWVGVAAVVAGVLVLTLGPGRR
jgi:uncharacterized membrane protein YidH (DUF202 family)